MLDTRQPSAAEKSKATRRIVIVTNVVPDYRYPVFEALHAEIGMTLKIFSSDPLKHSCIKAQNNLPLEYAGGINLAWTTRHATHGAPQSQRLPIPIALVAQLFRFKPKVIISGDLGLRSLVCWLVARTLRAKFVLWSEDISTSASGRSKLQKKLRQFLLPRAHAFLAWGQPASDYLREHGVQQEKIYRCAQAIDNHWWQERAASLDKVSLRENMGLQGTVFLLVGRLVALKGFANFIEAWRALPDDLHRRATAVIVGDGEQSTELHRLASQYGLHNIRFVGARSPEKLAAYYKAADALVFPSLVDVWGLVVNEALCFGLPILASKYAGATQELVAGRGTGEVFDPLDTAEFTARLSHWAVNPPVNTSALVALAGVSQITSLQAFRDLLADMEPPQHVPSH